MPGINLYYTFDTVSPSERKRILDYGAERNERNFRDTVLINDKQLILTCTGHVEYPFLSFKTDEFDIFLEGYIYSENDSTLRATLTKLAENFVRNRDFVVDKLIKSWLLEADGEFIAVTHHKRTGQLLIITDALGRLPLYYYKNERLIMISRHLDLVAAVRERKEFNRLAIAQYLMFGYSLGTTTLVQGVHSLEPCSAITIDPRSSVIDIQRVNTFCFSEKLHSNISIEENVTELARLLSVACQSRTNSRQYNVVSLSGGLDSRTIAACIHKQGIPLSATTMLDTEGAFTADARIAEQIAAVLGIEWKLYRLQAPRGKDSYNLLRLKSGLNYLAMNWIIQYLDALQKTHGRDMAYITGDGGDKVLVDLRPTRLLTGMSDLVEYIVSRHQGNSVQDASRITGISEDDIVSGLYEHLDSYPEADFANKLVHFVIFERGRRWLFEGEDRNRSFFWHLAPFYSIPFFRYAMNCPDEQKANHKLYRRLLVNLSPQIADIQNEHWGFPITSKKYYWTVLTQYFRDLAPRPLKRYVKGWLKPTSIPREIYKECILKQAANCDLLNDYLCFPEVIKRLDCCTKREAQTVLTITSTLELLASGRSTIKEYWEDEI